MLGMHLNEKLTSTVIHVSEMQYIYITHELTQDEKTICLFFSDKRSDYD